MELKEKLIEKKEEIAKFTNTEIEWSKEKAVLKFELEEYKRS